MQTHSRPKWQRVQTAGRIEFIRQHLDKSDTEIARLMGVHRTAVHQLRQRYGIAKVHSFIQARQRMLKLLRRLKPGCSLYGAAQHLGISVTLARKYGRLAGYQFLRFPAARYFYWRKRFKALPTFLTVTAVARELGVTYGYAALLCHRYGYKAKMRSGRKRLRVPIRHHQRYPEHERRLASLKPVKL
jgi:hypothetical protein